MPTIPANDSASIPLSLPKADGFRMKGLLSGIDVKLFFGPLAIVVDLKFYIFSLIYVSLFLPQRLTERREKKMV
jgi:hypothetical protein